MSNATNTVLDRIQQLRQLRSDYALAKAFKRKPAVISNYRRGLTQMDDAVAVEAAKLADLNPGLLLVQLQAERTKSPEARAVLLQVAATLRASIMGAKVAPPSPAGKPAVATSQGVSSSPDCILW